MQEEQMVKLPPVLQSVIMPEQTAQEKMEIQEEQTPAKSEKELKFERYWNIMRQKLMDRKEKVQNIDKYKQLLLQSQTNQKLDRALGCIYGAMIGDALGAYCQFCYNLMDKVVDEAMQMPGGGTFNLHAGQFTDDSEMATHLIKGLTNLDVSQELKKQQSKLVSNIALQYIDWFNKGPFDIGNTCRGGIKLLTDYQTQLQESAKKQEQIPDFFQKMYREIYQQNKNSLANGSLMRIQPFALFFSMLNLNPLQYSEFIQNQIRLTHPNPLLGQAGLFWINTLSMLIDRQSNNIQQFQNILNKNILQNYSKHLKDWIQEASTQIRESMQATKNMGYAKIAFSYGLKALFYIVQAKQKVFDESFFYRWIRWIIKRAGDTDTNACIAGGLLGSVIGFWNLPTKYVVKSLKTITDRRKLKIQDKEQQIILKSKNDYTSPKRPSFYEPANALFLAFDLVFKCKEYNQKHKK